MLLALRRGPQVRTIGQAAKKASRRHLQALLLLPDVDVNAADVEGTTALAVAVNKRQTSLVADLVASGRLEIDTRDGSGATALLRAARQADIQSMRALLDCGADANAADSTGYTPLMALATINQHKVMVELLTKPRGAAVNAQNLQGWAALHFAADGGGKFSAVKVLRSAGADTSLLTNLGKTAADLAAESSGDPAMMTLLKPPPPALPMPQAAAASQAVAKTAG